ncbi:hypothetical protein ACTMU2_20685 [Cupriavidus basilensis]
MLAFGDRLGMTQVVYAMGLVPVLVAGMVASHLSASPHQPAHAAHGCAGVRAGIGRGRAAAWLVCLVYR